MEAVYLNEERRSELLKQSQIRIENENIPLEKVKVGAIYVANVEKRKMRYTDLADIAENVSWKQIKAVPVKSELLRACNHGEKEEQPIVTLVKDPKKILNKVIAINAAMRKIRNGDLKPEGQQNLEPGNANVVMISRPIVIATAQTALPNGEENTCVKTLKLEKGLMIDKKNLASLVWTGISSMLQGILPIMLSSVDNCSRCPVKFVEKLKSTLITMTILSHWMLDGFVESITMNTIVINQPTLKRT